jgi:signal transduction histidine kinase
LTLLWLTFEAIKDQQQALAVIRRAHQELRVQQAESKREIEKLRLVEACLRDPLWAGLPSSYDQFSRRHRLVRHLLLWRDESAIVPIRAIGPQALPSETKLVAAQDLELSGRDLPAALNAYQWIASTTKDPGTQALALHRAARTLLKLGRNYESRAIWNRLGNEFGDQTDVFGRPYGLLAVFAPTAAEQPEILARFEQFQARRWPLSLEQQAFFLERFATVLGQNFVDTLAKRLREEEDLYRAIPSIVAPSERQSRAEARSRPVVLDGRTFEFWSFEVVDSSGPELRGLVVDPDWIASSLSPDEPDPPAESFGSTGWFFGGLVAFVAGSLVLAAALLTHTSLREARLGQEKSDFLLGLWHDVNKSLTAISVKAQALRQPAGLSRDESDEACSVILGRVNRLNEWINSALKKAQAEIPLGTFKPILLHRPGLLFGQAAQSFVDTYGCEGRDLSVDIHEPLPPARLDPAAVERALSNLLENACKYSSPGSTIIRPARKTIKRGLAVSLRRDDAHDRHAHRQPSPEDRARPSEPRIHCDRSWPRL